MAVEKHRLKRFLRRISTMGRGTLPTAALDGLPTTGNQPPFTKKELSKRLKAALPQRQKPTFEALEPRFLLSADLMPQVDTALLEGLDEFKAWTATLDEVAELNQALPLVDMSILDALDVPDLVQENLINPLNDYFNSLNVGELATTDGVVSALANLPSASGDLIGNAFIFDVEFDVSSTANARLELGEKAEALGFELIDPAQAGVEGDVAFQFSFGVDVSDGVVDVTDFFLVADDISFGLQDDDSPVVMPLRYNFVEGEVTDGSLGLDARVVLELDELDSNSDNRISYDEINVSGVGKSAGELTGISVGGDAKLFLPMDIASLPFAAIGDPTVEIGTPDIFASLDTDVSLNGDFDTVDVHNAEIRAALSTGLNGFVDAVAEIAETGLLGEELFPINGSINDYLDISEILSTHVSNVLSDYFDANSIADVDSLLSALNSQSGVYGDLTLSLVATGERTGDILDLGFAIDATRVSTGIEPSLGSEVQEFLVTDELVLDLNTAFNFDFGMSLNLANLQSPTDAVTFDLSNNLTASANFSEADAAFSAISGFLGLDVGNIAGQPSTLDFQADVTVNFAALAPSLSELENQAVLERATQTGNAIVDYDLRALSSISGAASVNSAAATISFNDDLFDENDGVLSENFSTSQISDFSNISNSGVRTVLGSLRGFLQSFVGSPVFNDAVPLSSDIMLGDVLVQGIEGESDSLTDFVDLLDEQLLAPLTVLTVDGDTEVEVPTFATIQELEQILGGLISNISFDAATSRLNFDISLASALSAVEGAVAVPDLGALSNIETDGTLTAAADVALSLSVGMVLTPIGSNIGSLNDDTLVKNLNAGRGVLTTDGQNDLEIRLSDGRTFEVNLDHDPDVATMGELLSAIQTAADLALGAEQFLVIYNENEDGLELIDRTAGSQPFEVRGVNSSLAFFGLGLGGVVGEKALEDSDDLFLVGSPLHGDTLSRHFILDSATLDGTFNVETSTFDGTASWGDLDVEIISGEGQAQTGFSIDLAEPAANADGTTTLSELISGLNNPFDVIGSRTDSSSLALSIPISPLDGFVNTNGFAPVYSITTTDVNDPNAYQYSLADAAGNIDSLLRAVEQLSISDLIAGISQTADYLAQVGEQHLALSQNIPGLSQSAADLFDFSGQFSQIAADITALNPTNLQAFSDALASVSGIAGLSIELDQTVGAEALRLDFDYAFENLAASIPLSLDLGSLGFDLVALGLDSVGTVMDAKSSSPIDVTGSGTFSVALGFDISDPSNPSVYLGDTSALNFSLAAINEAISFEALFGAIAVDVVGGKFVLDADGEGTNTSPINYTADFSRTSSGRYAIDSAATFTNVVLDGGMLAIDLPLNFPAEITAPQPNLMVGVTDLSDIANNISLSGPNVTNLLNSFSLLDNLDSFRTGWDELWAQLDQFINEAVLSSPLPILGSQLENSIDFVDQIRNKVSDNLSLITDTLTPGLIQQSLFDALGPGGLNWLQSGDGSLASLSDITVSSSPSEVLFDLALAMPLTNIEGLTADLALPGLGLDIDAPAVTEISIDLPLSLGISLADGVFVDSSSLNELEIAFESSIAGLNNTEGTLGFLPVLVSDAPGADNVLRGSYAIDFVAADGRLSRNDLMAGTAQSAIAVTPAGLVNIDLIIETNLPDGTVFSPHRLTLGIDWDLAADSVDIEFTDVEVDLVGLLKDFALPQLERIQESFGPLRPLVDFLNAGPPLLANIFGLQNWGDLAILFEGTNNTYEFATAVEIIDELVDGSTTPVSQFLQFVASPGFATASFAADILFPSFSINDLEGEAWISIGGMVINSDVARGIESKDNADDLIEQNNARSFLPEGVDDITEEGGFSGLFGLSTEFERQLNDVNDNSFYGQIWQWAQGDDDVTDAQQNAAALFIKTQELPGVRAVSGGSLGFGNVFSFGFPQSITRAVGIFGNGPVEPIHFTGLEDPSNAFRLLLGDTNFGRNDNGDVLEASESLLLDYQMPALGLIINTEIPANPWELLGRFVVGLGKALEDETPGDQRAANNTESESGKKSKSQKAKDFLKTPANWVVKVYIDGQFGYGYDATGLDLFKRTGDAAAIEEGFFLDDSKGIVNTIPAFNSFVPDPNNVEVLLGVGLDFSWSSPAKFPLILQAGISPQFRFGGTWDLTDRPENDDDVFQASEGRVRATEFDLNVASASPLEGFLGVGAFNFGLKADVLVTGGVALGINLKLVKVDIINVGFTIVSPPIFDIEFANDVGPNPVLAEKVGGTLKLNVGARASERNFESGVIDETFRVGAGDTDDTVIVSAFGISQTFSNISKIEAYAGDGDDTIIIQEDVTIETLIFGEDGNDLLIAGGGVATLRGGSGNDTLLGGSAADNLFGDAGMDNIFGGFGNDIIRGGLGADTIDGEGDDDTIYGEQGRDSLYGGLGNDMLFGGIQDDDLHGGGGQDQLFGEDGNDNLYGDAGSDEIYGGAGADNAFGGDGADYIEGGSEDDILLGELGNDEIHGQQGEDYIDGGANNDQLFGGDDSDTILGGGGSDFADGGEGADLIYAHISEDGDDVEAVETILGGAGNDLIYGNNYADSIGGGDGDDTIFGRAGNDWLFGGFGDDELFGETGSDVIWGGFATGELTLTDFDVSNPANFELPPSFLEIEALYPTGYLPPIITPIALNGQNVEGRLGDGKDILRGGEDGDFLFGGDEADRLLGSFGNDYLDAGAGDDIDVHGGLGDDVVRGGSGRDALHGDEGIDQIYGDGGDDNLFGDAGVDINGEHRSRRTKTVWRRGSRQLVRVCTNFQY